MTAGKLVKVAATLLLGGFVLVKLSDTLIEANPTFRVVASAIIGAFIIGATAMLKREQD